MGAERECGPTDTQPQDWVEGVQESGQVSWCSEVALPLLMATSLEMGVWQGKQRGSLSSWNQVCRVVAPLPLPEAAALLRFSVTVALQIELIEDLINKIKIFYMRWPAS